MSGERPGGERRKRLGGLAFAVLLGGGLLFWAQLRAPRDLLLDLDLTSVQPGDLVEVDVTVARGGRGLARRDERYGPAGAPASIHLQLRGRPGPAEVETTAIDRAGRARRSRARVDLDDGRRAVLAVRFD